MSVPLDKQHVILENGSTKKTETVPALVNIPESFTARKETQSMLCERSWPQWDNKIDQDYSPKEITPLVVFHLFSTLVVLASYPVRKRLGEEMVLGGETFRAGRINRNIG